MGAAHSEPKAGMPVGDYHVGQTLRFYHEQEIDAVGVGCENGARVVVVGPGKFPNTLAVKFSAPTRTLNVCIQRLWTEEEVRKALGGFETGQRVVYSGEEYDDMRIMPPGWKTERRRKGDIGVVALPGVKYPETLYVRFPNGIQRHRSSHFAIGEPERCKWTELRVHGKLLSLIFQKYTGSGHRGPAAEKELQYARDMAKTLGVPYREMSDVDAVGNIMSLQNVKQWLARQVEWLKDAEYVIVVSGGHGAQGCVQTTDHKQLSEVHSIEDTVITAIQSKPKLYFYQHCMGDNVEETKEPPQADLGPNPESSRPHEGSVRFHASTAGHFAYRDRDGVDSPFLRAVHSVIKPNMTLGDLKESLHKKFDNKYNQVPTVTSSLDMLDRWHLP